MSETKICHECGETLPLIKFYKKLNGKYIGDCRDCSRIKARQRSILRQRTYLGFKGFLWGVLRINCRNTNKPIIFEKEEFFEHLDTLGLRELFDKWKESGYKLELRPRIYKLDRNDTYVLGRFRLDVNYK